MSYQNNPSVFIEGDVRIGNDCLIQNTSIINKGAQPLLIGNKVTLLNSVILFDPTMHKQWCFYRFCNEQLVTRIEDNVWLTHAVIINSHINVNTRGAHTYVEYSSIGPSNDLRRFSNITLSRTGTGVSLGSETSKCIIGNGFVSEHTSSYLSLTAPTTYPIVSDDGTPIELCDVPNVSNIGAGTVFANYSGQLCGEGALFEKVYEKGTAFVWSTFTTVNARVINRYGNPEPIESTHELLKHQDLTLLGLGSFIDQKVTGRVPAFSLAGQDGISCRYHKLGWVLQHKPAMVATIIRNLLTIMGTTGVPIVNALIRGTLNLEITLLEQELKNPASRYTSEQLTEGLTIFRDNLDGRWMISDTMDLPYCRL